MVTLQKIGRYTNLETLEITGLSTDEKPVISINGTPIVNGSIFEEIDTGIKYKYDKDRDNWIEQPTSGNLGGNISLDYTALTNKPRINNVELDGNKTLDDLGIQSKGNILQKRLIQQYQHGLKKRISQFIQHRKSEHYLLLLLPYQIQRKSNLLVQ